MSDEIFFAAVMLVIGAPGIGFTLAMLHHRITEGEWPSLAPIPPSGAEIIALAILANQDKSKCES